MNLVLEMLREATDKDLMMTRFDCHVKGLHSIVLKNDNGKLTRCFIAERNHEMYLNINSRLHLPLGIHDHRYDLRLRQVTGEALNILYKENSSLCNVMKYKYESEIKGGVGAIYDGISGVEVCGVNKFTDIIMSSDELHTVYVPKNQESSWLVQEGHEQQDVTNLFQNGNSKCSKSRTPVSIAEVKDFVHKFYGVN